MRRLLPALAALVLAACSPQPSAPAQTQTHGGVDRLEMIDSVVGSGAEARPGMEVAVHYTGWLYDDRAADKHGSQFDSSRGRGAPFHFALGAGRVIDGWDQGVAGMKVGGKRTLLIPAALGYGARGAGGVIPPGASLVFDVELVGVDQP